MSNLLKFKKRIVSEETKRKISVGNKKAWARDRESQEAALKVFLREYTRKVLVMPVDKTTTVSLFYDQSGKLIHAKANYINPYKPNLKLLK